MNEKQMKNIALDILVEKLQVQEIKPGFRYHFNEPKSVVRLTYNTSFLILYDLTTKEGRELFAQDKSLVAHEIEQDERLIKDGVKTKNNYGKNVIETGKIKDYGYLFSRWVIDSR